MAGTKDYRKRRWQSVGGKGKAAQDVSGTDVLDSASGSSGKTELVTAQSGPDLVSRLARMIWTVRSPRSRVVRLIRTV